MKTKFFYSLILVMALTFAGATVTNIYGQTAKKATKTAMHKVEYTCPEHHDYVSDKPGKCPKCGMALVEKKEMKNEKMEKKEMKKETPKKEQTEKQKM